MGQPNTNHTLLERLKQQEEIKFLIERKGYNFREAGAAVRPPLSSRAASRLYELTPGPKRNVRMPTLHSLLLRFGYPSRDKAVWDLAKKGAVKVAEEHGLPVNRVRQMYLWVGKEVRDQRMRNKALAALTVWRRPRNEDGTYKAFTRIEDE